MPLPKHSDANAVTYLECRTNGHAWSDITASAPRHKVTYLAGVRITLLCPRCTTEREDIWSTATGEMQHRAYRYPSDYKYATADKNYRFDKNELRLLLIQQINREIRSTRRAPGKRFAS